ncbi:hypothetical protein CI102_14357 [Trichoderma harzianum]|nr:hypothetical protein CI102_14357 [Trichoderma harzianum]
MSRATKSDMRELGLQVTAAGMEYIRGVAGKMHSASHLESAVYSYLPKLLRTDYQIHSLNSMGCLSPTPAHLKTPEDLKAQFRSRSDSDPADRLGRTRRGGESHPSDLQYGVQRLRIAASWVSIRQPNALAIILDLIPPIFFHRHIKSALPKKCPMEVEQKISSRLRDSSSHKSYCALDSTVRHAKKMTITPSAPH